jgi:hypothetical protein
MSQRPEPDTDINRLEPSLRCGGTERQEMLGLFLKGRHARSKMHFDRLKQAPGVAVEVSTEGVCLHAAAL